MSAGELWVESYQGEVLGETLFGLLAARQEDPVRRHELEVLTVLERATKELAEPVLDARGLDRGDTAATVASAETMADSVAGISWAQLLGSIEPVTVRFLAKYEELVRLSEDAAERSVAETYVAHERALASFARRSLGEEDGEPLERILALPHVAAALG
ncbi:MAG: hypothetical protein KGJ77_05830 [Acidobacteriota bacterium]|nr:hypothetical protein [Acidobacteriota bacterium]